MHPVEYAQKQCVVCGNPFTPRDAQKARLQQFCSRACYWAGNTGQPHMLNCALCNQPFAASDSHQAKRRRFCSNVCARKSFWIEHPEHKPNAGRHHSEATKEKIKMALRTPLEERMKTCPRCNKSFLPERSEIIHCSRSCARKTKNGRIVDTGGYIRIAKATGGYALEHRIIMEQMLGRPMLDSEQVHHKDGNRQNNHPSNLELRSGPHGRGATMHCPTCTCTLTQA